MSSAAHESLLPRVPESLERFAGEADTALILGSGLGGLLDRFDARDDVPYAEITGFPSAGYEVAGHGGTLSLARSGTSAVVAFQGRIHRYQGFSAFDAAYPSRLAAALGCSRLIVTNAAGGLDPSLAPGDLMLISDHINLMGDNPLVGWPGPSGGTPFVPMGDAYDPDLISLAIEVATSQTLTLREGSYVGVLGPSYETPAEVEMLHRLGASAVGMSTVPEVIAARALDVPVLGISLITNMAGGSDLSHAEVLEVGAQAAEGLTELLLGILLRLET